MDTSDNRFVIVSSWGVYRLNLFFPTLKKENDLNLVLNSYLRYLRIFGEFLLDENLFDKWMFLFSVDALY